jgi:hypothetical protein
VSTPSVSVSVHDAYTPEIRDRILERLRASMEDTTYAILTPAHLRALAAIDSPGAPVLSLYLQLSPDRRARGAWQTAFSSLSTATLKRIGDRRDRRAMKDEFDRIEQTLQAELPALGRGVVFFTCRPIGLWRQIAVSVPLPDGAHLSARPYVRPLVRTRDEHDRFVLDLLSQERSRFFISQIGQVEEVFRVKGQHLHGMLTDRVARDRRDVLVTEAEKREARVLAHVAERVLAQFEGRICWSQAIHSCAPPPLKAWPKTCNSTSAANSPLTFRQGLPRSRSRPSPRSARSRNAKRSRL